MALAAHSAQLALMIGLPIALWLWLRARWKTPWKLIGAGALTFVVSQVVHLPLVLGFSSLLKAMEGPAMPVATATVLGLLAGLCEELARWIALRRYLVHTRGFRDAIGFGAGHGGGESVILGVIAAAGFIGMSIARANPASIQGEHAEAVARAVEAYWSAPTWQPLLGGLERFWAIIIHLTLSGLVMLAVVRAAAWPLLLAIGWHAVIDGISAFTAVRWGVGVTEIVVSALGLVSIAIIVRTRTLLVRHIAGVSAPAPAAPAKTTSEADGPPP